MQANTDLNSSLSDTDRYDIIIDSLIKIKEEIDKTNSDTISTICKQSIVRIFKDCHSRGELKEVKKRIDELLTKQDKTLQKHNLLRINKNIDKFCSKQILKTKSKGLSQ